MPPGPGCNYHDEMEAAVHPLRALLLAFAGWISRHQAEVIEYLLEENRVLKEQMRGRALRLNDDQRRRLAAKAKVLDRKTLERIATIVTPDTLMRWHRQLIALKWTFERKGPGRPGIIKVIRALIVRMAGENSIWGYARIQGELKGLGHKVARSTIAKVLKENGILPAPDRPTSWRTFLRAHWGRVAAMDFMTTEVWTPKGLETQHVLFAIDLKTRRVEIAGITSHPTEAFMAQVARNLTDPTDGFLRDHLTLICDSRYEVHRALPADPARSRRRGRSHPLHGAERQRLRRAIRAVDQVRVSGEDDFLRAPPVPTGCCGLHPALQRRTSPSGHRERSDFERVRTATRPGALSRAPRRAPQALLPSGRVNHKCASTPSRNAPALFSDRKGLIVGHEEFKSSLGFLTRTLA